MTRKHYIEVASILKNAREDIADTNGEVACVRHVTRELARMFRRDNSAFDAGRFFDAAGFPELSGSLNGEHYGS